MLQEIQAGTRKLAGATRKKAKAEGRALPGGALVELSMSHEGRRLAATINALASRIKRDELQFGLTPVASQRLENFTVPGGRPGRVGGMDTVERALCGDENDFKK
jgi:hypothetical protein